VLDKLQELDFEIKGLLLAPREFSYLKSFTSPVFDSNSIQLIELKTGLNVVFGKNGSGKTSLLKMIEAAAAGQCSPFEGLVIQLSEKFVDDKIERYGKIAQLTYGQEARETDGIFAPAVWNLSVSLESLQEWTRTRLALVSPKYASSLFASNMPARPLGELKGLHEYVNNSTGQLVELQITPLVVVNEDTPNCMAEIALVEKNCDAAYKNGQTSKVDVNEDEKQYQFSTFANARNFLGADYGYSSNSSSKVYFLDSLPGLFLTYPDTNDFQRERFSAPEQFISTIADGYETKHQGFRLTSIHELLKSILNRELKESEHEEMLVQMGRHPEPKKFRTLKESIEEVSRNFQNAFPIYKSGWLLTPQTRGLMMGNEPMVSFSATGAVSDQLSESEARWFKFGLATLERHPSVLLIDEPERGLDRNALREIVNKLSQDWLPNTVIVATSHSPSVLGIPNSNTILIKDQKLIPFDREEINDLVAYGIGKTDLVELHKAFVFVEGEHDKIVLDHYFGTELAELGAVLVPTRGDRAMRQIVNWSFFTRMTEVPLITVFDNLEPEKLMQGFHRAKNIFGDRGFDAARTYLQSTFEAQYASVISFLLEAIQWSKDDRIVPMSLAKKDVLDYLPENIFAIRSTWTELSSRFQTERQGNEDFKNFVFRVEGVDIRNPEVVRRALLKSDSVPHPDLENLISNISQVISSWRIRKFN